MTLTSRPAGEDGGAEPHGHGHGGRAIRPLSDFIHDESVAAMFLVAAASVALLWANSAWSSSYVDLWSTEAVLAVGDWSIDLALREWVNDAAMVLFFLVVGLEIKREVTTGGLRDPRAAALPVIGAFGGMVVPALIYTAVNAGGGAPDGWGIPMATDIAIVMGIVALIGRRIHPWIRLFLLTLAVADDVGAILVIAVFYSSDVAPAWLGLALGCVVVSVAVRHRLRHPLVYVVLGTVCWYGLLRAHVHPTLAGVFFGLLAPVVPKRDTGLIDLDEMDRIEDGADAARIAATARDSVSVVEWLLHRLHPVSAFVVVPVFALANAGVRIPAGEVGDAITSPVTWGVLAGLVVGKAVGIAGATAIAVAGGLAPLPTGVRGRHVLGAAALGGVGFTVSLFVTELAFADSADGRDARLGVLMGSLGAAIIGSSILLSGRRDGVPADRDHH